MSSLIIEEYKEKIPRKPTIFTVKLNNGETLGEINWWSRRKYNFIRRPGILLNAASVKEIWDFLAILKKKEEKETANV